MNYRCLRFRYKLNDLSTGEKEKHSKVTNPFLAVLSARSYKKVEKIAKKRVHVNGIEMSTVFETARLRKYI